MRCIRLSMLGGLEVRLASGKQTDLGTRTTEALLALLGCRPGEAMSRERMAGML